MLLALTLIDRYDLVQLYQSSIWIFVYIFLIISIIVPLYFTFYATRCYNYLFGPPNHNDGGRIDQLNRQIKERCTASNIVSEKEAKEFKVDQ